MNGDQAVAEELFGPYRLESLIGRGGMGEVHRAYDTRRDRVVALKRLPPALGIDQEFQERFRRESRVAARLTEPHILPIHDYGEIDGQLFLDMRLVEGLDLGAVLDRDGPLEPRRAIALITQIASALDAAHDDELVHRDVKPSNVLITTDSAGTEFAYLIDFGIARNGQATGLTATGTTVGTTAYMAPERFDPHHDPDRRVDVYSLACVLHQTLTGTTPFPGDDIQIMYAHVHHTPPRIDDRRPEVPGELDDVVARAMAKDPDQRQASAGQFATEAAQALAFGGPARHGDSARRSTTSPGHPRNQHLRAPPTSGGGTPQSALPTIGPPVGSHIEPELADPTEAPDRRQGSRHARRFWTVAGATALAIVLTAGILAFALNNETTAGPPRTDAPSGSGTAAPGSSPAAGPPPTVPVGAGPLRVKTSRDGRRLYTANRDSKNVTVIDPTTHERVADIPASEGQNDVALAPDGQTLYAAGNTGVHVVDTESNRETGFLPLPGGASRLTASPDGSVLYASLQGTRTVAKIDIKTLAVVARFALDFAPGGIAVSPDSRTLYAANLYGNVVSVLDSQPGPNAKTITVGKEYPGVVPGPEPGNLALSPDGRTLWMVGQGSVAAIDPATGAFTVIDEPAAPTDVAFSADGSEVYVTDYAAYRTHRYDTATRRELPALPTGPAFGIAISPDASQMYTTNLYSNTVLFTNLPPA